MCDIIKHFDTRVTKGQGEKWGKGAQKISKEIMAENLPDLTKTTKLCIQAFNKLQVR